MIQLSRRSTRFAILLSLAAFTSCDKPETEASKGRGVAPVFVVEVLKLQAQPFEQKLFATGSLVANESVQLQSERAGSVTHISFEESKPVKAGEVLVRIDDSELQAQLERAKAQLELAQTAERRQKTLVKSSGISAAEYEQAQANLHVAEAEVRLIQAQVEKTKIQAPFDGIPGLRRVSVGAYLQPGAIVCSFQDISALKMDFALPERYLGLIEAGQKVTFRIAGTDRSSSATVVAIEPSVDVQTRSLTVRAIVPNDDRKLLPGAFAEVQVTMDEIKDALLIPAIALIPGLQQQTVFVHKDGTVEERTVQAGIRTADSVQIVSGLEQGEEVITSGILQLRPGMKVKTRPIEPEAGAARQGLEDGSDTTSVETPASPAPTANASR